MPPLSKNKPPRIPRTQPFLWLNTKRIIALFYDLMNLPRSQILFPCCCCCNFTGLRRGSASGLIRLEKQGEEMG